MSLCLFHRITNSISNIIPSCLYANAIDNNNVITSSRLSASQDVPSLGCIISLTTLFTLITNLDIDSFNPVICRPPNDDHLLFAYSNSSSSLVIDSVRLCRLSSSKRLVVVVAVGGDAVDGGKEEELGLEIEVAIE
jgi:hypothetical protein